MKTKLPKFLNEAGRNWESSKVIWLIGGK